MRCRPCCPRRSGSLADGAPAGAGLAPRLAGRGLRIFVGSSKQPRFRRASDVLLLVPALVVLALLVAAYPPSGVERALQAFLDAVPGWLDPVWDLLYDLLGLWAILLVAAALLSRRVVVAVQALASAAVAAAVGMVASRIATGDWPGASAFVGDDAAGTFPVLLVALCAAAILAASPFLVRPLQAFGRWTLLLGAAGAALASAATPGADLAALAVAVVSATSVRLLAGTSAGLPEPDDVRADLAELGVAATRVEPAARRTAGAFVVRAEDDGGRPLHVKVYGRDAYDSQLLAKLWRTLWYQGAGPRLRLSRLQAVEHEALLTLLAAQAGVPTRTVVTAGEAGPGDALLVLRDAVSEPDEPDDATLALWWVGLDRLARAGIAHLRIEPATLALVDGKAGLVDFDGATLAARHEQLATDRAQLLATTAVLAGPGRALAAANGALGEDGVTALLPYLQAGVLTVPLRQALKARAIDLDGLRAAAAEAARAEAPRLVRLRRVTWWTLVQIGLLALAVWTVLAAIGNLDHGQLRDSLDGASWWWVAAGFVVAQLPRQTQAASTLGSVPARLAFRPVYVMQLATGYMNLALPSGIARMAVNIRFFQRQGIPPTTAVTAGAIDSFTSTVVQAVLLVVLLLFSSASLSLAFELPSGDSLRLAAVVAGLVVAAVAAVALVPRLRNPVVDRVRTWWPEVRGAVLGLRGSDKLGLLLGGSLATELLFATALGIFANALGYDVSLAQLLVMNVSISLLGSLVPIPGNIGVAELGLTVGLVSAGMTEEAALAAVLLYRASTFYLPPSWGFFAMRSLQRNGLL
jgi:uncharacterized membrane protein YbhN (UPF0104 family)